MQAITLAVAVSARSGCSSARSRHRGRLSAVHPKAANSDQQASSGAPPQAPAQRRAVLAAVATALVAPVFSSTTGAAAAAAAAPAAPPPDLEQRFTSSEGFAFSYPSGWVVAFDRSGGGGGGAVCVVGSFSGDPVSVAVFREPLAEDQVLDAELGASLTITPVEQQASTLRFARLRGAMDPQGAFAFEYKVETCRGEILEATGGRLLCLGPSYGQELQTSERHIIGRALVKGGRTAYMVSASTPESRWEELRPLLSRIIDSFELQEA